MMHGQKNIKSLIININISLFYFILAVFIPYVFVSLQYTCMQFFHKLLIFFMFRHCRRDRGKPI